MPKWTNKGHEFDELGEMFIKNSNIVHFACNTDAHVDFKNEIAFLDVNVVGIPLESIEPFFSKIKFIKKIQIKNYINTIIKKYKNSIFILNENCDKTFIKYFKKQLKEKIFLEQKFLLDELSIYALYVKNLMYKGRGTCVPITTLCSLNCKYCSNFQPYNKDRKHFEYDEIIKNIDAFFNVFDRVKYFSLTGGEPFLHPRIKDILSYVAEKYSDKIHNFSCPTNGTVVPSDDIMETIKKYNIEILCDNYTKSVARIKDTYEKLIDKYKEFKINYVTQDERSFIRLFPPQKKSLSLNNAELIAKYTGCKETYSGHGLKQEKIYTCCLSGFAETAKILEENKNDSLPLDKSVDKKEMIEFILGYTELGYAILCKYCNGFPGVNKLPYDENGVSQVPHSEILEWSIDNPTFEKV